jgi:hypothetical protein
MKPLPQVSHKIGFPLTDYNYQPTAKASYASTKEKRSAQPLREFWRLGTEFHGAEAVYGDAADFFVFSLLGIFCTWPIYSVGIAIVHVFLG